MSRYSELEKRVKELEEALSNVICWMNDQDEGAPYAYVKGLYYYEREYRLVKRERQDSKEKEERRIVALVNKVLEERQ